MNAFGLTLLMADVSADIFLNGTIFTKKRKSQICKGVNFILINVKKLLKHHLDHHATVKIYIHNHHSRPYHYYHHLHKHIHAHTESDPNIAYESSQVKVLSYTTSVDQYLSVKVHHISISIHLV